MVTRSLSILIMASFALATIINVPGDAITIQGGINESVDGDTILVAPGAYLENIDFYGKGVFLTSHLVLDQDTSHVSATIIDGSSSPSSTVTMTSRVDTNAVINGFTIRGGRGSQMSLWVGRAGGGVLLIGGGKVTNNHIIHNQLQGNIELDGGGILVFTGASETEPNGIAIVDNNLIAQNTVNGLDLVFGGGISVGGQGFTFITNNTILNNSISGRSSIIGGGLSTYNAPHVTASNNIIQGNSVEALNPIDNISGGGGVFLGRGTHILYKNLISGNTAPFGGGIVVWGEEQGINLRLINNTIADNLASIRGGGLFLTNGHCTAINSIVWGNSAPEEPGIYYRGEIDLTYSITQQLFPGLGNLQQDPAFQDSEYSLTSGSPAIDAGSPDPAFNDVPDPANPTQPLWPAMGSLQADMGAFGGNDTVHVEVQPYTVYDNFLFGSFGNMPYRYAYPLEYDSTQTYPLTIVLHGYDQWGTNNIWQLFEGLPWRVNAEHYGRNEFTLCPQAPTPGWTIANITTAYGILRDMIDTYPIDTTRIVVTGWSNGGGGSWRLVSQDPDLFAAVVPIAQVSGPREGTKYTPSWMYHGSEDGMYSRNRVAWYESMGITAVYAEDSTDVQLMNAIEAGARLVYSEFEGADHYIIKYAWDDPHLFEWLDRQRLRLVRPNNPNITYVNSDSIHFKVEIRNPNDYQFNNIARVENYALEHIGDFILFDDGLHGDGDPLDGNWGNYLENPHEVDNFRIGLEINNLDLEDVFYFQDLAPFTTQGPLVYETLEHLHPAGGAISPNTSIYFNVSIRNMHETATAEDIIVQLEQADSNATVNGAYMDALVEDIPPGGVGSTLAYVSMRTSANCAEGTPIHFNLLMKSNGIAFWRDTGVLLGYVGLDEKDLGIPTHFDLMQNYPNPFNPFTSLQYAIPEKAEVQLTVFDVQGREVIRFDEGERSPGYYSVLWDGLDRAGMQVNTGVYFCRLQAGTFSESVKLVLLK